MKKELTTEQLAAIRTFASQHGRTWKSELNHIWQIGRYDSGDDSARLQQIRNSFGPTWLTRFKLHAEVALGHTERSQHETH